MHFAALTALVLAAFGTNSQATSPIGARQGCSLVFCGTSTGTLTVADGGTQVTIDTISLPFPELCTITGCTQCTGTGTITAAPFTSLPPVLQGVLSPLIMLAGIQNPGNTVISGTLMVCNEIWVTSGQC